MAQKIGHIHYVLFYHPSFHLMMHCAQTARVKPMSPLSLCREPGMSQHLFPRLNSGRERAFPSPVSQKWQRGLRKVKWFSSLQSWDSEQIFWFCLQSLSLSPYGLLLEEAGRGAKTCQRSNLQISFWSRVLSKLGLSLPLGLTNNLHHHPGTSTSSFPCTCTQPPPRFLLHFNFQERVL